MEILIKSSALIIIFYLFYLLFLSKETFYKWNRVVLLSGIFLSFVIPFVMIPIYKTLTINIPGVSDINIDNQGIFINLNEGAFMKSLTQQSIGNTAYLWIIYTIGVLITATKLILSFFSIKKIINNNQKTEIDGYNIIDINEDISPFSFFKNIVVNKSKYSEEELKSIMQHELTHVKQWHTLDIILANILCVVLWFNPFSYLYKRLIEQNLEYIADSTVTNAQESAEYEYLLLKSIVPELQLQMVNNFLTSPIKRRIMMINSTPSKSSKKLVLLVLIPVLSLFLYSFNTKNVYVLKSNTDKEENISFIHPLKKYKKISSKFGDRIHPVLKVKKFHTGIDYIPGSDLNVLASASGIIKSTGYNDNDGNFVLISHNDGYETRYIHLKKSIVKKGMKVKQSQAIGIVGSSGKSVGTHLHFEVLKDGKYIDPLSVLPGKESSFQNLKKYFKAKVFKNGAEEMRIVSIDVSQNDSLNISDINNLSDINNNELEVIDLLNSNQSMFLIFMTDKKDEPGVLVNVKNN